MNKKILILSAIALLFLFSSAGTVRANIVESQPPITSILVILGWIVFFIVLIGWYAIRHLHKQKQKYEFENKKES
jgi:hypothetical protein